MLKGYWAGMWKLGVERFDTRDEVALSRNCGSIGRWWRRQRRDMQAMEVNIQLIAKLLPVRPAGFKQLAKHIQAFDGSCMMSRARLGLKAWAWAGSGVEFLKPKPKPSVRAWPGRAWA
ncbi:hypothetical protein C8R45DRAFT_943710 [Mycena sanguinolenta]|nr:hypothetical protein C8R45DRAFT_943710 [Mycena sanguinolenta]